MKIYVGNIPYDLDEEGLRSAFVSFGEVLEANIALFRDTGRSRGFGFVVMPDDGEAQQAIAALNGSMLGGRRIRVMEARPSDCDHQNRPTKRDYGYRSARRNRWGRGDDHSGAMVRR